MVVDLLDYDVRFGQGFLFSPPRPVRAEALQGTAGAADASPAAGDGAERAGRGRHRLNATALPPLIPHFSTLAADYDVLLCDVWGVVHNGVAAFPARLRRADARARPRRRP